jgi:transcription initiation factor TFIIE subunit beta
MSNLSAQLSAFKNKIKSGPTIAVPRKPQIETTKEVIASNNGSNGNNKRVATANLMVSDASKRPRVSLGDMSGSHLSTQLHLAVEYIKQHDGPVPVSRLQSYLTFDITHSLLPLLKEIDRLKYDRDHDTLQYVSLHNIQNSDDLLNFLRAQATFKGTSVKELKDGWSGYLEAITELEQQNKILVLRNKKENAPRLIWPNLGGELGLVDDEYKAMWASVKIPEPDNLYQALIDQSLKPTGADPSQLRKKPQQQEKKQKRARRGKITNTHMKGILKDYSQLV